LVENQRSQKDRFRVPINIGGSSRYILVSAPENLPHSLVARRIEAFSSDKNVQNVFEAKPEDCPVEVLTEVDVPISKGDKDKIIGFQILECPN
jgi:hypothetical protein